VEKKTADSFSRRDWDKLVLKAVRAGIENPNIDFRDGQWVICETYFVKVNGNARNLGRYNRYYGFTTLAQMTEYLDKRIKEKESEL